MSQLTFYTNPVSRGAVVRWLLTELEVEYDTVVLTYDSTENPNGIKSSNYLAINPMGKVPALKDGDTIITETAAICAYLTDKFAEKELAPALNSPLRGEYYRWLFFAYGVLEPAVLAKSMDLIAPEDQQSTAGYGTFDNVINTLQAKLTASNYLCGDRFTTADLYLANALGFYLQFKIIPELPEFVQYVQFHSSRDSFAKAKALDTALMS